MDDKRRENNSDRRQADDDRRYGKRSSSLSSKQEQIQFLKKFETESDRRLTRFFFICIILAITAGFYFTFTEIILPEILEVINNDVVATVDFKEKKKEEKKKKKKEKKKKVHKKRGAGAKAKGRRKKKNINGVGVLKLLTSKSKSSSASAYTLMDSKMKNINKSLDNIAMLKTTGKSRFSGRKGKKNAGFNEGFTAEGSGGIDGMLGGLLGGSDMRVAGRAKGKLRAPSASEIDMGHGGNRRSAASILRVVRAHSSGLRHSYNKHLKKNPGFSGKINIKFEIAPSGKVIKATISSSTTGIPAFDAEVKKKVRRWKFEAITGSGNDIVTIPFTFSE